MGKKLNWPMISTFIIDYIWGTSLMLLTFYINLNSMTFTSVSLSWAIGLVSLYLREYLNFYLLSNTLSKDKTTYQMTWEDHFNCLQKYFQYAMLTWLGAEYNFVHCRYSDLQSTYLEITIQYWGMCFLRDFTSMKYVHPWMHDPKNYWIHKYHHKASKELNAFHTYKIGAIDGVLENFIGPFIYVILQYLVIGKFAVHFLAIRFTGWADSNTHSANPYSIIHFNPFFEYFCKPNLEHNLHHIIQQDYYMFNNNMFQLQEIEEDVKKYNEECGTKISFSLYVD